MKYLQACAYAKNIRVKRWAKKNWVKTINQKYGLIYIRFIVH